MNKVAGTLQQFEIVSKFLMGLFLLSARKSKRHVHKLGRRKNCTCGHKTAKLFDLQPLKLSDSQSFNSTRPFPKFLFN